MKLQKLKPISWSIDCGDYGCFVIDDLKDYYIATSVYKDAPPQERFTTLWMGKNLEEEAAIFIRLGKTLCATAFATKKEVLDWCQERLLEIIDVVEERKAEQIKN